MERKEEIHVILECKEPLIAAINAKVWEYAELGFQEFRSAELYRDLLAQEGFEVISGLDGMPTAFEARFGDQSPVIGILAEYDALPGLSQEAGKSVKSPLVPGGSGHGCGHNSLGAGAFGAAVALKEYMQRHDIKGTIKLFGCPSEEKGNAKTFLARDGFFDDLDAAFTWHPMDINAVWGVSSLANVSVVFKFKGRTAHAAAAPHLGRSALDSAEIMSVGVNYLREHIIPEARVHYAYLDVGGRAPNVVQDRAEVHYFIRAPKVTQVLEIYERVKDIAKGAALIAGTESSFELYSGLSDFLPNPTLSKVLHEAMVAYGPPEFDEEDFKIAKAFFETLSDPEKNEMKAKLTKKVGEEKAKQILERPLDTLIQPLQLYPVAMPGSTDVGDASHVVPTAQLTMATNAMGTAAHTWQMSAQANTSVALKGTKAAAGALALAILHVLENPQLLEQAREELNKDTGGQYICPIPGDLKPRLED